MASYKVPQDVEADDKLIGFLSMKQFIFVVIAVLLSFMAFQLAKLTHPFLIVPFLPFIIVFGALGLYQRKDQPAETFLLAMVGFYLKPNRRKWDQDGIMDNVKVTAPKKVVAHYSDGLSKNEVTSNLARLSQLMDTRGWVAKNAEFQTNIVVPSTGDSDRLINLTQTSISQPQELHASDDMLDVANNPTAQNFDALMRQASQHTHDDAVAHMKYSSTITTEPHFNPAPTGMHQKVLEPVHDQSEPANEIVDDESSSTMTPPTPDAILELANRRDNNLSVETIAKEAERVQSLDKNKTIELH